MKIVNIKNFIVVVWILVSVLNPISVFAEGNPFVPTTDVLGTGLTAQVGAVELNTASQNIANFTDISGAYYDSNLKRIVFFGRTDGTGPKYSKDDMAVAIESIFFDNDMPNVIIKDDPSNPSGPTAVVSYDGTIQNTNLGSTLFNSDYKLKQYVVGFNTSNTKISSLVPTYKSVVDRYMTLNSAPVLGNQTKFILSPQNVVLKNSAPNSAFVFSTLSMMVAAQPMSASNDPKWNQAANEFAGDITLNFDQYGKETTAFIKAKQLAKIISVLKWIQDNNIPTDLHWAQNYLPETVATPLTAAKVTTPILQNGYSAQGQVSYLTPNSYVADDGAAASLKASSQAASTAKDDVVWTFTNGGQQYQAVAVAAQAFKTLGGYSTSANDFSVPIAGDLSVEFNRSYSSFNSSQLGIGIGWDMMPARLAENLFPEDFNLTICNDALFYTRLAIDTPNGHETFTYNCPAGYSADDPSFHSSIVQNSDEIFTITSSSQIKYKFNSFLLTSVTDKNGNSINYSYDGSGRLTSIADTKSHALTITYNPKNLIASVTDWSGRKVQYTYDASDRLIGVIDPRGNTTVYGYDSNGRLSTITNRNGELVSTNTYNSDGKIATQKDAAGLVKTNAFDVVNKVITQTDLNNRIVKTFYDTRARVLQQIDALGKSISFTYGNEAVPLTQTDRNNNKTAFTYDSKGNVLSVIFPDQKTVTYTYDNGNRITKVVDNRYGVTPKQTDYTYDAQGNQTQRNEAGSITKNTYDATGEALTFNDPLDRITTWTRDSLGNVLIEKDPLGSITTHTYDSVGRLTKITDSDSKVFSQSLDANGNVLTLVNTAGTTANLYDKENRLLKITLPNNTSTQYAYNSSGSLLTVTDALNSITTYTYDVYQNLLTQKDTLGKITSHIYDVLNRHVEEKTPMLFSTKFEYDSNGNTTKRIDSVNRATTYTYDPFNRVIRITYPDLKTVTYTYDNRGNKVGMVDSVGTSTFIYDNFDRITQATNPYSKVIKYEYDKADNLLKLTYPDNKVVTYTYDANNQMLTVTDWNLKKTTYTYNKNGAMATRAYPNTISTKYAYDDANRLVDIEHKKGTAVALKLAYQRDAIGNIIKSTPSGSFTAIPQPITYTYDALGRVATQRSQDREGDRDYTYDKVGNIITQRKNGNTHSYTYDNDYRLQMMTDPFWGTLIQGYDANGNVTARRQNPATYRDLAYDFDNRLIQSKSQTRTNTFKYDGDGNRLENTELSTRRFVNDLSGSLSRVLVETNEYNDIENWFVYGVGLISEGGSGTYRDYYLEEANGNMKVLTSSSGSSNRMAYYDAFGEVQWGDTERYGLAGQEYDETTKFNYMRARYYDPYTGRFLSRDPVKGKVTLPQSQHPYMYAYNNPVNISDPSGECPCLLLLGAVLAPTIAVNSHVFIALGDQIIQDYHKGDYLGVADKVSYLIPGGILRKPAAQLSYHAIQQMSRRGISAEQVFNVLRTARPFKYYDGSWKLGFYDAESKIFVGLGDRITTVINKVDRNYIDNLLQRKP